jgi:hypothetical protein
MTQEALKQVLEFFESGNFVYPTKIATDLRQAIAELESQEPVAWVCCGSGEKHDIDFYEDDVNALPVGTMLYTHQLQRTEQEPVKLPCCGYTDASAVKWNPFNRVVQCHNCGQTYTQPQRTWVGLTDKERFEIRIHSVQNMGENFQETLCKAIEAKLKQLNT